MFEYDQPKEKPPTDYTGLIIGVILAPVFLVFAYLGKDDLGLAVVIVLGAMLLAIKIRWDLRKHAWFWATIIFILALHVPLLFIVPWQGKNHVRVYGFPIGIADFLVIQGAIGLAEKVFSKHSSSSDGSL